MRRLPLTLTAALLWLSGAWLPAARGAAPEPRPPEPRPAEATPAPETDDPTSDDDDEPGEGEPDPDPDPEVLPPAPDAPAKPKHKPKPKHKHKPKADLPLLHEKLSRRWMFLAPIDASLAFGYADGWHTRDDAGALIDGQVAIEPQLRWRRGRFRLRLPLVAAQRGTFGFQLPETRLGAGLIVSGKPVKGLEIKGGAHLARALRPGWADFYQPVFDPTSEPPFEPDGALRATDRYGTTAFLGNLGVSWRPMSGLELGLGAEVEQKSYDHDPHFDAVLSPTHLTPNDRRRVSTTLRLRTEPIKSRLHANLSLGIDTFDYQYAFARDAGTGLTHAGIGGAAANPLMTVLQTRVEPDLSVLIPAIKTRFSLDLHWVHHVDRFQGYYTWDALGGGLAVRVRPIPGLKVEADYALDVRGYTHAGYQTSPTHLPLQGGDDVRKRIAQELGVSVAWSLLDGQLEPFISARWHRVDDSMPDYVPWMNPPGEPYAVDFDEPPWWTARIGVRVSL